MNICFEIYFGRMAALILLTALVELTLGLSAPSFTPGLLEAFFLSGLGLGFLEEFPTCGTISAMRHFLVVVEYLGPVSS